jgi:hypothetical protein
MIANTTFPEQTSKQWWCAGYCGVTAANRVWILSASLSFEHFCGKLDRDRMLMTTNGAFRRLS